MDMYKSFSDLIKNERENTDFSVRVRNRPGTTVIIAPHGGGIEPGTSEVAVAIAADDISLYTFEGIKPTDNRDLHLTSTVFDEPQCLALVVASPRAIAVHGESSAEEVVFLGGRDTQMLKRISDSLVSKGFRVERHSNPALQGQDKENICNRTTTGCGVQMELSNGLRLSFFQNLTRRGRQIRTERFHQFVAAVRDAIL